MKTVIIILFAVASIAVLLAVLKSSHPFKNMITSSFQGIISMMAVNVLGLMTGVTISVNWYTILSACIFGIPSTITMVLLDMFLI